MPLNFGRAIYLLVTTFGKRSAESALIVWLAWGERQSFSVIALNVKVSMVTEVLSQLMLSDCSNFKRNYDNMAIRGKYFAGICLFCNLPLIFT